MSVARPADYEEKEKWLLRPVRLASDCAYMIGITCALMWYSGDVAAPVIAGTAIVGLLAISGLLIWATRRIMLAARGQV